MLIQMILTIWLLALIYFTNHFRREGRIAQQRIFSVFLIVWATLGIIYYNVWAYTSGYLEQASSQWQTYLPAAFFSICAGLGIYYLLLTFGKFRVMAEKNQQQTDKQRASKQKNKQKKSAGSKQPQRKK